MIYTMPCFPLLISMFNILLTAFYILKKSRKVIKNPIQIVYKQNYRHLYLHNNLYTDKYAF